MPKVSVIVPTYNRLPSLKRAVNSVFNQSFRDFDVWIIDDASTDGTAEWLCELQKEQPAVRVISNDSNIGVSRSRNLALKASQGEWLALLDSDDEWTKDKLEKQLTYAQEVKEAPLIHTEEIWIRNGVRVNPMKKHQKQGGYIFDQCFELCRISPSASLLKRTLLEEVGYFREDFPVCEDFELWLRITMRYPIGFLNEALTIKYGGHSDQLSRKFHSMDYWRVKALMPYLDNTLLEAPVLLKLSHVILAKCEVLLKGYEKHQNFANYDEVKAWLHQARNCEVSLSSLRS